MRSKRNRFFWGFITVMLCSSMLITGCSQDESSKGALFIRHNLENFYAQTTPYNTPINFTLSQNEVVNGFEEPIKITTIYNTSLYITELTEREDSVIIMNIGLKYHYQAPKGKMLSLYKLNDNNTFTNSDVSIKVYNDQKELLDVARGSGDGEKFGYEQWIGVQLPKEMIMNNENLSFEIDGLYILSYEEK